MMEALELYKEEGRKMEEHKYACEHAGKEVETLFSCTVGTCVKNRSPNILLQ